MNVSLFLLLYAVTSTFLYFQQAAVVSHSFASRAAQTQFFASVDLGVNVLTLAVQLFLTGRILKRFGVGTTLSLLPVFSVIGFGAVALIPTLASVVGFQLIRRAGNFAIARPTREVLFTVLPREDRYKAKSFIDTAVYRLGDQLGAWSFALLTTLGLGLTQVSVVAAAISGAGLPIAGGSAAARKCWRASRKRCRKPRARATHGSGEFGVGIRYLQRNITGNGVDGCFMCAQTRQQKNSSKGRLK